MALKGEERIKVVGLPVGWVQPMMGMDDLLNRWVLIESGVDGC